MAQTYLLRKGQSGAYLHEMLYRYKSPHFATEGKFIMIHRLNYNYMHILHYSGMHGQSKLLKFY
jgi:hypothetical protein